MLGKQRAKDRSFLPAAILLLSAEWLAAQHVESPRPRIYIYDGLPAEFKESPGFAGKLTDEIRSSPASFANILFVIYIVFSRATSI